MCICKISKTILRQNLLWESASEIYGKNSIVPSNLHFFIPSIMHTHFFTIVGTWTDCAASGVHTTNLLWAAGLLVNDAHDDLSLSFTYGWGLLITVWLYRNDAAILQTFVEGTFINTSIPNLPSSAGLVFTVSTCLKRWTMSHHSLPGYYNQSSCCSLVSDCDLAQWHRTILSYPFSHLSFHSSDTSL